MKTADLDPHIQTTHELKCWPEQFDDLAAGRKTFEYRRNDRGYQVGHRLWLRRFDPQAGYTGPSCMRTIQHILAAGFGLPEGYVVLSLKTRSVLQPWVESLTMMQQSVLLAAIRGPDGQPKYGGGAKMLLRWFRRCVLLSAMDGAVLEDPIVPNGGSFTGPSLDGEDDADPWEDRMQVHVNDYLRQVDMLPHHYQLHFMHAAEILGYKHPAHRTRHFWYSLYIRLVHDLHLWPETEEQMDSRLGDCRSGWLQRADPATVA